MYLNPGNTTTNDSSYPSQQETMIEYFQRMKEQEERDKQFARELSVQEMRFESNQNDITKGDEELAQKLANELHLFERQEQDRDFLEAKKLHEQLELENKQTESRRIQEQIDAQKRLIAEEDRKLAERFHEEERRAVQLAKEERDERERRERERIERERREREEREERENRETAKRILEAEKGVIKDEQIARKIHEEELKQAQLQKDREIAMRYNTNNNVLNVSYPPALPPSQYLQSYEHMPLIQVPHFRYVHDQNCTCGGTHSSKDHHVRKMHTKYCGCVDKSKVPNNFGKKHIHGYRCCNILSPNHVHSIHCTCCFRNHVHGYYCCQVNHYHHKLCHCIEK